MIKQRIRRIESFLNQCDPAQAKPPPRRLQTVQDVIDLVQEQVEAVRAAPWTGPIDKARAIAYLAGVARKTIEAGILAARVEMLEAVLTQRKEEKST
jgi:hypothetical protein